MANSNFRTKVVYFVGFLDLFGVSVVALLVSKHARDLGASRTLTGFIGSLYGGLQLFANPYMGKWSDDKGRRHVLGWCMFLSAVGYTILGASTSLYILLLARIILGIFKCTQEQCRSYLADCVEKSNRAQVFGAFNSASSIGFIIGPTVGGHIAEYPGGFYICALVCASIFFLNALIVYFLLPEATSSGSSSKSRNNKREVSFFASFFAVDWTQLWDVFLVRFFLSLGIMVYRSNFNLWLDHSFGIKPSVTGYLTSYTGLLGTLSGFGVGFVALRYTNDAKLWFHTAIVQFLSIASMLYIFDVYSLALCMAPLSLANAVARVASTNVLLERTKNLDSGVILGLGASVLSLARMLAPSLGGISQEFHESGPIILGALFVFAGLLVMFIAPKVQKSSAQTNSRKQKQ